jgi:hypothetical protein
MQFLRDFLVWMGAVLKEVYYWLPSSALAAAIGRGVDLGFWRPGKKTAWTIVLLGFVFSAFKAWRKQLLEKCKAEQIADDFKEKLEARRPKLSLNIETAIWVYDEKRDVTVFVLAAGVLNSGESTVVIGWKATYELGESSEEMDVHYLLDSWKVTIRKETLTLTNENLLIPQVLTKPLVRGDAKLGRLMFAIRGNRKSQVDSHQFKIKVSCQDFEHTRAEAVFIPSSKPLNDIKIYPGEQLAQGVLPLASSKKLKKGG